MRDALLTQVGIRDVKVNIQSNQVTCSAPTDHAVPLERIERAVTRAGYQPVDLTIKAAGTFESDGDRTMFRIAGWPKAYEVSNAPHPPPTGRQDIKARVVTENGVARLEILNEP